MKKPHIVTVFECKYEGENIVEEKIRSTTTFNQDQEIVHRLTYDEQGGIIRKEEYEYSEGKITQSKDEDLAEGNISEASQVYEDGLLKTQLEYYNQELTVKMSYTYDEKKRMITNQILNNDDSLSSLYKYEYIDNKTIEEHFDEEMTLVKRTESVQNDEGRLIDKKVTEYYDNREVVRAQNVVIVVEELETIETYFLDGRESFEIVKEVNSEGQLVEISEFDIRSEDEVLTKYTYDPSGQMIKEVKITNDEITLTKHHSYDTQGNILEITEEQQIAEDFTHRSTLKFVNEYLDQ